MPDGRTAELARRYFDAFQAADRETMESLLPDDFTFTSPYDDHIGRARWFERCWPHAGSFRFRKPMTIFAEGDECFVMYETEGKPGGTFRNTEHFTFRDGLLRSVEVFFGFVPGAGGAASAGSSSAEGRMTEGGELVVSRVFDAPRERVFRAWTDPDAFAHWFGPRGTTLPHCRLDARPGGEIHFLHRHADGTDVWVRGTYREIVEPERLVLDFHFSNEAGERVERPGFNTDTRVAVTVAEEPAGTKVTLRQTGLVSDQGEMQGWTEALDRLAEILAPS